MTNREKAREFFEDQGLTLVEIANILGVPPGTVRGWKCRERWNVAPLQQDNVTEGKPPRANKKKADQKPNGRPPFQPKNKDAEKFGFFARYLPEETRDIVEQMKSKSTQDILFEQIQLAYAAILRAQNVMYVKSRDDMTREIQGESSSSLGDSTSYLVQMAWDKQANFMAAQAKVQASLNAMIRQYEEMCRSALDDEEQRARIEQIKANTAKVTAESSIMTGSTIIPDAVWRGLMNDVYAEYLTANQPTQIFFGGSSSGKSFAILGQRVVRDIMTGKRNYLIVRKTARTIRNSAFNEVWKCITRMDLEGEFSRNKSDMVITHKSSGCQILFCGLDDVEKVKSITPQIGVITDIVIEEATETEYNDYKSLIKRLRGLTDDSSLVKRMVLLFNPILQDHWIYTEFFAGKWDDTKNFYADDKLLVLRTTYKDNRWLTEDDIRKLEDETDKYYYDVYTLGKWGILGNLIFTNWVIEDLSKKKKTWAKYHNGLDFGFYPDPAAFVRVGHDRARKEVYIFSEIGGTHWTNDILAEELKPIIGKEVVTCDSAEPKSIQELNNYGINAVPAVKGPGSVEFGIKWLQRHKIIIDKSCIQTINEIRKFKYMEDRNGNVLPKPVDRDNHFCSDALRYALEQTMVETKVV
ncbi:MAG: PBSX family phage terminase large subunit [Oscillospiraceae bacterium]|nr:PBSX family phage terminase large subunit [Oscillospiraceae bacterium]